MGWILWGFIGVIAIILISSLNKSSRPKLYTFRHMGKVTVLECEGVPQGINGLLELNNELFSFASDNYKKQVPITDILSISCANSQDIINGSSFSVSRALLGGAVFGALGGAVGGFSGSKNVSPKVIIVNYKEDDENKYLYFSQFIGSKDSVGNIASEGKHLEKLCELMNNEVKKVTSKN